MTVTDTRKVDAFALGEPGWIEAKGVAGATIWDLLYDDDDYGVVPSMGIECDRRLWHVWVCVADGTAMTAYAAYHHEGALYLPAELEGVDTIDTAEEFANSFRELIPVENVIESYRGALEAFSGMPITRSLARDLAFAALRDAVLTS